MKFLIFLIVLPVVLCAQSFAPLAYIDGNTQQRIVIKLQELNPLPTALTSESNSSTSLETIATSLNEQVTPLFSLPLPLPDSNITELNSTKELRKYLTINLNDSLTKQEIIDAIDAIKELDNIDIVYAEPTPEIFNLDANVSILPEPNAPTPNLINNQGYLNSAPYGIDAKYAWGLSGGNGDGVKIIDVENAWNRNHEDLPDFFAKVGSIDTSSSKSGQNHGTAVVGILVAKDNEFGIRGIVSNSQIGTSGSWYGMSEAIVSATQVLGKGDVIVIENHNYGPDDGKLVAMEYWTSIFDAIKYATDKGVTVVEAAGNGSSDLDNSVYNNAFNRNYRDSGAILVAASKSTQRVPVYFTNYGSRIDAHAWGDWTVASLGYGDAFDGGNKNRIYTNKFAGTSSATPIVAGAVASLQGIAKQKIGRFLTPKEVRTILSSTATPQSGGFSKRIAGLPNLRSAIAHLPAKPVIPNKPSNASVSSISDNSVTLQWTDNSNNEIGYRIYKGSTLIATLPANVTSYTINNLADNTSYTYTIKSFNSSGESSGLIITFKTEQNVAWMIPVIYYPILLSQ